MILEGIRMVADWVGRADLHSAGSVNDQLVALPRDAGDRTPQYVAGVYDETRDDVVARRQDPPSDPALYVMLDAPYEMHGEVPNIMRRAEDVPIVIRLIVRGYDTAKAKQETLYLLEAVVASLQEMSLNENAGARTRNGVCIESFSTISHMLFVEAIGESYVTGAVVAMCNMRDARP